MQAASAVLSEELQGVIASIEAIRETFIDRERPEGLPAPGQPLPPQHMQVISLFFSFFFETHFKVGLGSELQPLDAVERQQKGIFVAIKGKLTGCACT